MNKENCALKLVDEIILYYDARSKKHQNVCRVYMYGFIWFTEQTLITALNIMNTMNLYDKAVVWEPTFRIFQDKVEDAILPFPLVCVHLSL